MTARRPIPPDETAHQVFSVHFSSLCRGPDSKRVRPGNAFRVQQSADSIGDKPTWRRISDSQARPRSRRSQIPRSRNAGASGAEARSRDPGSNRGQCRRGSACRAGEHDIHREPPARSHSSTLRPGCPGSACPTAPRLVRDLQCRPDPDGYARHGLNHAGHGKQLPTQELTGHPCPASPPEAVPQGGRSLRALPEHPITGADRRPASAGARRCAWPARTPRRAPPR
jgi:hypothetical protein